ncbi:hypothetical protein N7490_004219 [Penicillium lividum]|nr:hypothetical protein N7490_004219 [Penicillium lividum]
MDRSTRIKLPGFTSELFATKTGIPQGSPISPILFLLFNTPLKTLAITNYQYKSQTKLSNPQNLPNISQSRSPLRNNRLHVGSSSYGHTYSLSSNSRPIDTLWRGSMHPIKGSYPYYQRFQKYISSCVKRGALPTTHPAINGPNRPSQSTSQHADHTNLKKLNSEASRP